MWKILVNGNEHQACFLSRSKSLPFPKHRRGCYDTFHLSRAQSSCTTLRSNGPASLTSCVKLEPSASSDLSDHSTFEGPSNLPQQHSSFFCPIARPQNCPTICFVGKTPLCDRATYVYGFFDGIRLLITK